MQHSTYPERDYPLGLAGYGRLLRAIGETSHQSCLVLTRWEAPAELAVLRSEEVRIFPFGGSCSAATAGFQAVGRCQRAVG